MLRTTSSQRFDNRVAQFALALFGGLIVLLGLSGLAAGASVGATAAYLLFGLYTVFRGLRSSTVVVDGSGAITRSMMRTHRYTWSDLVEVEVVTGRTGVAGFGREYLVFHRTDGRDVSFKELNCPPPKGTNTSSVVRRAADCINARLRPPDPS